VAVWERNSTPSSGNSRKTLTTAGMPRASTRTGGKELRGAPWGQSHESSYTLYRRRIPPHQPEGASNSQMTPSRSTALSPLHTRFPWCRPMPSPTWPRLPGSCVSKRSASASTPWPQALLGISPYPHPHPHLRRWPLHSNLPKPEPRPLSLLAPHHHHHHRHHPRLHPSHMHLPLLLPLRTQGLRI